MKLRKAQTAMEFLMTYGWAILIVIAVVAALYAMGVFKLPGGGLAPCAPCFPAGAAMAYKDHTLTQLVVTVGPHPITVTAVSGAAACGLLTVTGTGTPIGAANSDVTMTCTGNTFSGAVSITYTDTDSGLVHTTTATLHGA